MAWLERELYAPSSWISKLIYITVRKPYHDAALHINGEPVAATRKQPDQVVYEVTSYLVYPGWNLIDLRKEVEPVRVDDAVELPVELPLEVTEPEEEKQSFTEQKPVIYVDVIPAGPHFESVRLKRERAGSWTAECKLGLPPIFPFPVRPGDRVPQFELVVLGRVPGDNEAVREIMRQRFGLRKRPTKPLPFSLSFRPRRGETLTVQLFEFTHDKRVLRDEYYPIPVESD